MTTTTRCGPRPATLFMALAVALAACGDDASGPDSPRELLPGTYEASMQATGSLVEVTMGGETTDFLALGASLRITLNDDGTTAGRLFVPEANEGEDLDADMAGTWTLDGTTVTFDQATDTFVRDAEWSFDGQRLRTELTEDAGTPDAFTVRVVLVKQ